jgi:hypothetical protein
MRFIYSEHNGVMFNINTVEQLFLYVSRYEEKFTYILYAKLKGKEDPEVIKEFNCAVNATAYFSKLKQLVAFNIKE